MTPREIAGAIGEMRDPEHVQTVWEELADAGREKDVKSEFDKLIAKAVSNIYRE